MAPYTRSQSRRSKVSSASASSGVKKTVPSSSEVNAVTVKKHFEAKTTTGRVFPAWKLPAELRHQILQEALAIDVPLRLLWNRRIPRIRDAIAAGVPWWLLWDGSGNRVHTPDTSYGRHGLLCANKQLYEECRAILVANTPLVVNVSRFILHESAGIPGISGIEVSSSKLLTQDEVVAAWKSLSSFDTVILNVERLYFKPEFVEQNLEIILGSFFGSQAKKDPEKKIVIRLDFESWFLGCPGSMYLIDVLQTWLPESKSIQLECGSAMLNDLMKRERATHDDMSWRGFFKRFSDRIKIDVDEKTALGIVTA